MKKIIRKRGGGKTTELIKMSAKTYGVIVCKNQSQCDRIFRRAHEMELKIPMPITYGYAIQIREQGNCNDAGLLIDETEDFIKACLISFKIEAITLTDEELEEEQEKPVTVVEFYQHTFECFGKYSNCFRPRCVKCKQDVYECEVHTCRS
jgi:hypothetical protein